MMEWGGRYRWSLYWNYSQLKDYQLMRLKALGIANSWEEFYKLPLTTKEDLRKNKNFISAAR